MPGPPGASIHSQPAPSTSSSPWLLIVPWSSDLIAAPRTRPAPPADHHRSELTDVEKEITRTGTAIDAT
jgi:hypothetical protein